MQGIGGCGVNLLIKAVANDLVPLQERGSYMAGIFAFMRASGSILGVAIPVVVFNAQFAKESYRIVNENARNELSNGRAC